MIYSSRRGGSRPRAILILLWADIACLSALQLGACDDQSPGQSAVRFPVEAGTRWDYVRTLGVFNFRADMDTMLSTPDESFASVGSVAIARQDTLFAPGPTWLFQKTLGRTSPPDVAVTGEEHFFDTQDGLYLVAHRGLVPLPPKARAPRYRFRQWTFGSLWDLSVFIENMLRRQPGVAADSFIVEDPPLAELLYPLFVGSTWTYREAGNPWYVGKKVVAFEQVSLPIGHFDCFKVQWLIDVDDDGSPDDDIEYFDWVSSDGIVLRQAIFRDLVWISPGGNTLGLFDAWDESRLLTIGSVP